MPLASQTLHPEDGISLVKVAVLALRAMKEGSQSKLSRCKATKETAYCLLEEAFPGRQKAIAIRAAKQLGLKFSAGWVYGGSLSFRLKILAQCIGLTPRWLTRTPCLSPGVKSGTTSCRHPSCKKCAHGVWEYMKLYK